VANAHRKTTPLSSCYAARKSAVRYRSVCPHLEATLPIRLRTAAQTRILASTVEAANELD